MVFMNPLFLGLGLAALAIPLAVHLLMKQRARVVSISTLRFLVAADQRLARRNRLREILLLLLRMAALAALALALSRPYLEEAELPGVSKEDLDVSVSEKTVTIKASTRREEEKEEGDYHRREISTGLYSRTLSLPAAVEGENARAEFKDGVLRLTLPKSEESKRISIQVE